MLVPVQFIKKGFILSKSYPDLGLTMDTVLTDEVITLLKNSGLTNIYVREVTPYEHIINDCLNLINGEQSLLHVHNLLKCQNLTSTFEKEASDITMDIIGDILNKNSNGQSVENLSEYDSTTYQHSLRVCVLSLITGMHMNLSDELLKTLGIAALLHDLGKLCVDKSILNKPTNLSNSDWCVIRMHPVWGADLAPVSHMIKDAIRAHHERLDGQGYPLGLKDTEIPLLARIIAVADVYDALTSVRPYRLPWSSDKVMDYLEENAGTVFDEQVVLHFKEAVTIFPEGTLVLLSDNSYAIVTRHNAKHLHSPTVVNHNGEEIDLSTDERTIVCAAVNYVKDIQ